MHEQWQPSDDFLRKSSLQGIYLDSLPTAQELAEFRIYWMAEGKAYHQAQWSRSWQGGCRLADRSNQHYLITTFRTGTALKHGRISCEQRFYRDTKP